MSTLGQSRIPNKNLVQRINDVETKIDVLNKKIDALTERISALSMIALYIQSKQLEKVNKKLDESTVIPSVPADIPFPDSS